MPQTKKKKKKKNAKKQKIARASDKYDLYQRSVQEPEHEIEFFDRAFTDAYGRRAMVLREDFCGTFAICCQWAASNEKRRALGVDLDPEPLAWGRKHNLAKLSKEARERVILEQADVRSVNSMKADILAAQNFSFWIFKTRSELLEYFRKAASNLAAEGMMVMDMMGGTECYEELEDVRKIEAAGRDRPAFKYVWEQATFNPVTHDASFYIHFRFKDGSKMPRIFEYHWRFWTIPEVRELLTEAGFSRSIVYWEDDDENWHKVESADSDPSWIAYIVALK